MTSLISLIIIKKKNFVISKCVFVLAHMYERGGGRERQRGRKRDRENQREKTHMPLCTWRSENNSVVLPPFSIPTVLRTDLGSLA